MMAPDAGLPSERSWLSWQRTELSSLGLAGLLLKVGLSKSDPVELAAATMMLVDAAVLWVGRTARRRDRRTVMHAWVLRCVAGLSVLAAALVSFSFL